MTAPAPTNSDGSQVLKFTATYGSPNNGSFVAAQELQAPATDAIEDKTKYLRDLRKATLAIQEQVNKELTQRMEEDKAKEAGKATQTEVDEDKEEENYGEEVIEEEE